MDKLKLAHDYALKQMESLSENSTMQSLVSVAWQYADAMQAEADKRINKERPDVLLTKDKDGNCLHFHHEFGHKKCMDCGASLEEWQPDWSQAPDWAAYWIKTSGGSSAWLETKPRISSVSDSWVLESIKKSMALSFGYAGTWQDSLRKRPQ